jgi:hypothetical protein
MQSLLVRFESTVIGTQEFVKKVRPPSPYNRILISPSRLGNTVHVGIGVGFGKVVGGIYKPLAHFVSSTSTMQYDIPTRAGEELNVWLDAPNFGSETEDLVLITLIYMPDTREVALAQREPVDEQ